MPPTLLHRTLVYPLGRAGPRPEASRNAHAFDSHSPGYGGFRGRRGRPRRPAGEHHEHSAARGDALLIFEWLAEPPKGRASSASAGFGGGGGAATWRADEG